MYFFYCTFRFWGTCADHAGLWHTWQGGLLPPTPIIYIWHFSPCYLSPTSPLPVAPPLKPPTDPSVWCSPPCVHVFLLFNTCLWVRTCGVDFLFLCQFADNDGFQNYRSPYKGHELIVFYGFIVSHGVYVPHFPCPVYHRWTFGFIPGLCHCKQCHKERVWCVFKIEWFIILWIYIQ